jgi:ribose-phosphate pyrophosphokinase
MSNSDAFITPEKYLKRQSAELESAEGKLLIACLQPAKYLADEVVRIYRDRLRKENSAADLIYLDDIEKQFSDGETCIELRHNVRGSDVFLFQSIFSPSSGFDVNHNYLSFYIACRTFKEHGAKTITGVLPYLAYARQDKPTKFKREPTTARLMADLSISAGLDRLTAWDPHSSQIRGFYGTKTLVMLEPLSFLLNYFTAFEGKDDVIAVSPDAGGAKLVTHFARAMNIQSAVASKFRPHPEAVEISEIIGNFTGKKSAVILDDMIGSAGTVQAVSKILAREKGIEAIYLAASHNLCSNKAYERLIEMHEQYNLRHVYVTDSIPQQKRFTDLPFFTVYSIGSDLALTINRIHFNSSVSEVFYNPPE